jgi:hypothetical protein
MNHHHYLSPKLVGKAIPDRGGHGLFAAEDVREGELLIVWGGDIRSLDEFTTLTEVQQMQAVMVDEGLLLVSFHDEAGDWINHSCDPNAWLIGQISIYARRDIPSGEEVCYDYATTDGDETLNFVCGCGSALCRGMLTASDYKLPELQARYKGHFSPYLQRRIERGE